MSNKPAKQFEEGTISELSQVVMPVRNGNGLTRVVTTFTLTPSGRQVGHSMYADESDTAPPFDEGERVVAGGGNIASIDKGVVHMPMVTAPYKLFILATLVALVGGYFLNSLPWGLGLLIGLLIIVGVGQVAINMRRFTTFTTYLNEHHPGVFDIK